MSGFGRLVEVANVGFVALQFAESGFGWLAGLEKRDGPEWVVCRRPDNKILLVPVAAFK